MIKKEGEYFQQMGCGSSRKEIQQIISTDSQMNQQVSFKVLKVDPRRPLGDVCILSIEKPSELSFPLGGGIIFEYDNQKLAAHMLEYGKDKIKFALLTQNSRILTPNQEIKYTTFQITPRLVLPQENILFISHSLSIPIMLQLISIYKIQPLLNQFLVTSHHQGDIPYINVLKKYNCTVIECYKNPIQKMEEMIPKSSFVVQSGPVWQLKETQQICQKYNINNACLPCLAGVDDVVASQWLINGEQCDLIEYEYAEIEFAKAVEQFKVIQQPLVESQTQQLKLKPIEIVKKSENEIKKPKIKPIISEKQAKPEQISITPIQIQINLSNFQTIFPYPFEYLQEESAILKQIQLITISPIAFQINLKNFQSQFIYPFDQDEENSIQYKTKLSAKQLENNLKQQAQKELLLIFDDSRDSFIYYKYIDITKENYIRKQLSIFDQEILDSQLYETYAIQQVKQESFLYDEEYSQPICYLQQNIMQKQEIRNEITNSNDENIFEDDCLDIIEYHQSNKEVILGAQQLIVDEIINTEVEKFTIPEIFEYEIFDQIIYGQVIQEQKSVAIEDLDILVNEQTAPTVQNEVYQQQEDIQIFEFDNDITIFYEDEQPTVTIDELMEPINQLKEMQQQQEVIEVVQDDNLNIYEYSDDDLIIYISTDVKYIVQEVDQIQSQILTEQQKMEQIALNFINSDSISLEEKKLREEAFIIFKEVDISQDYKIDFQEAKMAFLKYNFQLEDITYVMGLVDTDENSLLNFIEFYRFISILTAYNDEVDIKQILFIAADVDLSGKIDQKEFQFVMKKLNAFAKFGEQNVLNAINLVIGDKQILKQEFDQIFDLVKQECKKNM